MLFEDNGNLTASNEVKAINLSFEVTETEVAQLLSANQEIQDSCPGGVCQANWRPVRKPKVA